MLASGGRRDPEPDRKPAGKPGKPRHQLGRGSRHHPGSALRRDGGAFSGAVAGALLAFALVVVIGARNRFAPGALLLTGVAFGTFAGALISLMIASGDPRAFIVLAWSMGPTYRAEPMAALTGAAVALLALLSFPLFLRWLRILPLGTAQAQALGVRPVIARFTLMAWVAVLTGVSTLAVGPVSFAGLMAPHLARALGASGPGIQGFALRPGAQQFSCWPILPGG